MSDLDLLGPFKKVLGGMTHLLITVNKFTKVDRGKAPG
jgi:hypothetical protein